jgi:hypothetical protein
LTSRVLLTAGTVLFAAVFYALMLKGWRARQRRQGDLPPPPVSTGDARRIVQPVPGLFVGTTSATDWLDRIAVHRLSDRSSAALIVAEDGIQGVTIEQSLAGKVISGGMLVLTWRLGTRSLATAFRATDHSAHARLRDAITALLPVEAT